MVHEVLVLFLKCTNMCVHHFSGLYLLYYFASVLCCRFECKIFYPGVLLGLTYIKTKYLQKIRNFSCHIHCRYILFNQFFLLRCWSGLPVGPRYSFDTGPIWVRQTLAGNVYHTLANWARDLYYV